MNLVLLNHFLPRLLIIISSTHRTLKAVLNSKEIGKCNFSKALKFLFYEVIHGTKAQYFQFSLVHRTVGTIFAFFLHQIILKGSPMCTFCNSNIKTLEHLFFHFTELLRPFWQCLLILSYTHCNCNCNFICEFVNVRFITI